jgi:hypothetical protein
VSPSERLWPNGLHCLTSPTPKWNLARSSVIFASVIIVCELDGPRRTASDEIVKYRFGAEPIA